MKYLLWSMGTREDDIKLFKTLFGSVLSQTDQTPVYKQVLEVVGELIGKRLNFRLYDDPIIYAKEQKSQLTYMVFIRKFISESDTPTLKIKVESVLKQKRKNSKLRYLINGQASTGMTNVIDPFMDNPITIEIPTPEIRQKARKMMSENWGIVLLD